MLPSNLPKMAQASILFALTAVTSCGSQGGVATTSPSAPSTSSSNAAASPSPSPSHAGSALYFFAPEAGSGVGGTVQLAAAADGVALTATVSGLAAGHSYIVDADPLPCELIVGGPSQSFAKALTFDAQGRGTVRWTVPKGMDGSVSVQELSNGSFAVVACADLSS